MVTKRRLAAGLLLLGLGFVGVFHAIAALVYDSGLELIGAAIAGLSLLGLVLLAIPPDDAEESANDSAVDDRSSADEPADGDP